MIIILGPPPTKKSHLESDKSAFLAIPLSTQSLSAGSEFLAGPSSAVMPVAMTEVATGLDTKLGLCKSVHPDYVPCTWSFFRYQF